MDTRSTKPMQLSSASNQSVINHANRTIRLPRPILKQDYISRNPNKLDKVFAVFASVNRFQHRADDIGTSAMERNKARFEAAAS